jgi:hypothetical protein
MGYQALADAGFIDGKTDLAKPAWTPFAKSLGVDSVQAFLANQKAQDVAVQRYAAANDHYLRNYKADIGKLITSKVTGIPVFVTESGMLAAAHLRGYPAVEEFLTSKGAVDREDDNHVHISEYMAALGGHGFTFDSSGTPVDTPDTLAPLIAPGVLAAARVKAAREAHEAEAGQGSATNKRSKQQAPVAPFKQRPRLKKTIRSTLRSGDDGAPEGTTRHWAFADTITHLLSQRRESRLAVQSGRSIMSTIRNRLQTRTAARQSYHSMTSGASGSSRNAPTPGFRPVDWKTSQSTLAELGLNHATPAVYRHRYSGKRDASSTAMTDRPTLAARVNRPSMPVFAPTGSAGRYETRTAAQAKSLVQDANAEASPGPRRPDFVTGNAVDRRQFGQALTEYFDQQTRLPPSGTTGFDPRLTPAWAGQTMTG